MKRPVVLAVALALGASLPARRAAAQPTPAAAPPAVRAFVDSAERVLADLAVRANRAQWVAATYITDDTEQLSAEATERLNVATQRFALAARRYDGAALPADVRRKLTLLKLSLVAPLKVWLDRQNAGHPVGWATASASR